MLQSIYIKNFALIDEIQIEFCAGFNIITGETGSGKSIVLGALGLVLGERADTSVINKNSDKCIIEAQFVVDKNIRYIFDTHELDFDATCILRREINNLGKSRAFVNDTPVNISVLKEIGSYLIDMVSQHETLELNQNKFQMETLDAAADNGNLFVEYSQNYHSIKTAEKKLTDLQTKESNIKNEQDYIQFLLNEFAEAKIKAGEETQLEQDLNTLEHAGSIIEESSNIIQTLKESDFNIIAMLKEVLQKTLQLSKYNQSFEELHNRIKSVQIELDDIAAEIENTAEKTQANPQQQQLLKERLDLINHLLNKHRAKTTEELLYIKNELSGKNDDIESLGKDIIVLQKEIELLYNTLNAFATKLSERRKKAATQAEKGINELMKQAGLQNAIFKIELLQLTEPNQYGIDAVDFLFAANKGSNFLPVSKTASGGELGRLMLCIKTYIAGKTKLATMIFDEIDTGISGETAIQIGRLMQTLSNNHQLIAVTHLPQIAARAENHYKVYKEVGSKNTITKLEQLDKKQRLQELAHMLGGENYSDKTLAAAKELMR
ncbi:MAG: DNA repair protein RecN [Bacteroidota bacterium]|nr:DNA repair protein RecN [Bacteroidota bacterium]